MGNDEAYQRKIANDEANRQARIKELEDDRKNEALKREAERQRQESENLKNR